MASVCYTEDLICSVCLTIFTDPVILLCGHSFCRECITESLKSQDFCPLCHTAVSLEQKCLPTSHVLKSLAEKAKEDEKRKRADGNDREVSERLCHEHDEKFKLFCVTDQQLTCVICRDGEKHEGHKFKPIKEAAASVRQELEKLMQRVSDDMCTVENLADSQREEITKSEEKSHQLMNQISTQFEEMHQFLRKREEEIKNELKQKEDDDVQKMTERLSDIQTVLSEDEVLNTKLTSVLEITEPERFLKICIDEKMITTEHLFTPTSTDLSVVSSALNLGPFESHLQFFVWKEMLQIIKPREEKLLLTCESKNVTVSDDGRSLFSTASVLPKDLFRQKQDSGSFTFGSMRAQSKRPSIGPKSGLGQTTTSSVFASDKDSHQTALSSLFGSTSIETKPPPVSGFSFGSAQTTSTSVSGSTSSETKPPPVFGFSFGSAQTTSTSVSGSTSSETKSHPVSGLSFGSAQTTSTSVSGSTSSETKPPPVFGFFFGSAQTTSTCVSGSTSNETKSHPVSGLSFGSAQTTSTSVSGSKSSENKSHPCSGFSFGTAPTMFTSVSGSTRSSEDKASFVFGHVFGQSTAFDTQADGHKDDYSFVCTASAFSINQFDSHSGQHYWEIEVGQRDFWKLGITNYCLKYDGQKYAVCNKNIITEIKFTDRPKKIGFYLNCLSKELSFYDGTNMKHIHTLKCSLMSTPVSAFFGVKNKTPDYNPLTVCWY